MAGNGTIGLEILEDLPDADAVLIPWGGGGLTTGIASAVKALRAGDSHLRGRARDGRAGHRHARGGRAAGGRLPTVVRRRLRRPGAPPAHVGARQSPCSTARSPVSLDDTAAAVRLLAERARVIAEGAGALATAAALSGRAGSGKVVCIVSGGNIDFEKLTTILGGGTPGQDSSSAVSGCRA